MAVLQGLWLRKRLQRLIRKGRSRLYNRLPSKGLVGTARLGQDICKTPHPLNFKARSLGKHRQRAGGVAH